MTTTIPGHFQTQLATLSPWAASTVYATLAPPIVPSPGNGFFYSPTTGGTSGTSQPNFPIVAGATVADNTVVWTCRGTIVGGLLAVWDQEQAQSINADNGGTWSPTTALTFLTTGGGVLHVTGPTAVTNDAILNIATGAQLILGTGDFPRNSQTHLGRKRRIVTSCLLGVSATPLGIRPDFSLASLDAVACSIATYAASADDKTVTVSTSPVRWRLTLDVHDTATLDTVELTYRAVLGTPRARVLAVNLTTNAVTPLSLGALGADADGFLPAPSPVSTEIVQTWPIPASDVLVERGAFAYLLEVLEDQSQTTYPYALPLLTDVYSATTVGIDLAKAPHLIDGQTVPVGARVLVKNQINPAENSIYAYPGTGLPFAVASNTPIQAWATTTVYASGDLVQGVSPTILGGYVVNGLYYKVTAIAGSHTSGINPPTWPLVAGDTVIDNAGANQITWTCQGPLDPYTYKSVVEIRTYGLLQGSTVNVQNGDVNRETAWQYIGQTIQPSDLGSVPVLSWVAIPTGVLAPTTNDVPQEGVGVFAALGNIYHAATCDFVDIETQAFQ